MNKNPNTDGISLFAKKKSELALQRVEKTIKELVRNQELINFNNVANRASVSKSFLYNNLELRNRIEHLRKQQIGLKSGNNVKRKTSDSSKDVIIASLKNKNEELKKEIKELKQQLHKYLNEIYDGV